MSHSPGRPAAFATRQAEPAPGWIVRMGGPLAHQPRIPLSAPPPFLSAQTHSAEPFVRGGARSPTPNPSHDGVSRSWLPRA